MRAIVGAVVASAAVLVAATAVAGPCATAERGTYLSNVCFLTEQFTEENVLSSVTVASFDKNDCTVTFTKPYDGLAGDTIYFDRADRGRTEVFRLNRVSRCWRLLGEAVSGEGKRSDAAVVCGYRFSLSRLQRALDNLYGKYCQGRGRDSEF